MLKVPANYGNIRFQEEFIFNLEIIMPYSFRIMSMSEHTDQSWEELFNCEDDIRRNYCVFNTNSLRVIEDTLTFSEAKEQATYWNDIEEQDQMELEVRT